MTYQQELELQERITFFKKQCYREFGAEINVHVRRQVVGGGNGMLSRRIIRAIEQVSGMSWGDILSGRTTSRVTLKRIYIGLMSANSEVTLKELAQQIDCTDHSTAIHHRDKYNFFYANYDDFTTRVHHILDVCNEGMSDQLEAQIKDIHKKL